MQLRCDPDHKPQVRCCNYFAGPNAQLSNVLKRNVNDKEQKDPH